MKTLQRISRNYAKGGTFNNIRIKRRSAMPYCSLDFTCLGMPVVAHSQWDERQTQCTLCLFTDHQHAHRFLTALPDAAEAQDFARFMMHCALPSETDEEGVCRIQGDTASTLTNFLVRLRQQISDMTRNVEKPDLMGFWEPPVRWKAMSGIIMWFHPDDGYRVVIAHTRDQAARVMHGLSWLQGERQQRLLGQIKRWNTPRRSDHAVQEIKGVIAEVLCKASLAAKVSIAIDAMDTRAKAAPWD